MLFWRLMRIERKKFSSGARYNPVRRRKSRRKVETDRTLHRNDQPLPIAITRDLNHSGMNSRIGRRCIYYGDVHRPSPINTIDGVVTCEKKGCELQGAVQPARSYEYPRPLQSAATAADVDDIAVYRSIPGVLTRRAGCAYTRASASTHVAGAAVRTRANTRGRGGLMWVRRSRVVRTFSRSRVAPRENEGRLAQAKREQKSEKERGEEEGERGGEKGSVYATVDARQGEGRRGQRKGARDTP